MRRNSLLAVLSVLFLAACGSEPAVKISLDVPGTAAVAQALAGTVFLPGFYVDKAPQGFDVSAALVSYFVDDLKPRVRGTVAASPVAWPGPEALSDRDFWKTAGAGRAGVLLTGRVEFAQETRKALLDGDRGEIDGPFKPKNPWSERRYFSLRLDLAVLDTRTGEPLFRKEYKEAVNTENTRQTAEFALFEMMGRIKLRLYRAVFGSARPQERYLLIQS